MIPFRAPLLSSIYSAGGSDPHWSSVVLLMGFEGSDGSTTMPDEGPLARGNAGVVADAQIDTAQFKYGASSLLLDGTGDYIEYADNADWLFPGQFTVECFVRFSATAGTGTRAFMAQYHSTLSQRSWSLEYFNGNLRGIVSTSGTAANLILDGAWTPSVGTWYHVAMDRDGFNVVRTYLDGTMKASDSLSGTLFNAGIPMQIGSRNYGTAPHIGHIDEVRVTKGVARYASDSGFTVPTEAYPRS